MFLCLLCLSGPSALGMCYLLMSSRTNLLHPLFLAAELVSRNTFTDIPWRNIVATVELSLAKSNLTPKIYCFAVLYDSIYLRVRQVVCLRSLSVCVSPSSLSHNSSMEQSLYAKEKWENHRPEPVGQRENQHPGQPALCSASPSSGRKLYRRHREESQLGSFRVEDCGLFWARIAWQQGRQLRKSRSYKTSMQRVESQMEIQGIWKGSALGRLPDSITTSCRGWSSQAMQRCQVEMPANLHWYSVHI